MSKADHRGTFTQRQEKKLLRLAAELSRSSYPNPSRKDCPGRDVLENMAYRRLPPESVDPLVVDHIATCSPCFNEYTQMRKRKHTVKLLTIAVVGACLGGGIMVSVWLSRRGEPVITHKEPRPAESKRETTARLTPTTNAVLDLRFSSPTRSEKGKSAQLPLPRVPRAIVGLTILLPLGSEEGEYEMELLASNDRRSQTFRGQATFRDQAEVLGIVADTRDLTPGEYDLRLRTVGTAWRSFRVQLE